MAFIEDENKQIAKDLALAAVTMTMSEFELKITDVLAEKDRVNADKIFEDKVFDACKNIGEVVTGVFTMFCNLKQIENFVEFSMLNPDGTQLLFTVRRHDGKTPGKLVAELKEKIAQLELEAQLTKAP